MKELKYKESRTYCSNPIGNITKEDVEVMEKQLLKSMMIRTLYKVLNKKMLDYIWSIETIDLTIPINNNDNIDSSRYWWGCGLTESVKTTLDISNIGL